MTPFSGDSSQFGPVLGDAEFDFIRHVIIENAGIVLGPNKRQLVQGRLARRLRELNLPSYEAYCEHVRESGPEELVGLITAQRNFQANAKAIDTATQISQTVINLRS